MVNSPAQASSAQALYGVWGVIPSVRPVGVVGTLSWTRPAQPEFSANGTEHTECITGMELITTHTTHIAINSIYGILG